MVDPACGEMVRVLPLTQKSLSSVEPLEEVSVTTPAAVVVYVPVVFDETFVSVSTQLQSEVPVQWKEMPAMGLAANV